MNLKKWGIMSKKIFSLKEIEILRKNKFVKNVSEKGITYSDEFKEMNNIKVIGLMGMATFTDNQEQIKREFEHLKSIFDKYQTLQTTNFQLQTLSMGMSGDYQMAISAGSTLVRIGSLLFGARSYAQ